MKKLFCLSLVLFLLQTSVYAFPHQIQGSVKDAEGAPIPSAVILHASSGAYAITDSHGSYSLPAVAAGDQLEISHMGYAPKVVVLTEAMLRNPLHIVLTEAPLSLEQVVLTPKVNTLQLISGLDFQEVPVQSAEKILALVPGLFTGQHAGGGKAEQIFMRGFDVDHGTDVAIEVDGMPVNQVSHAHGQGYADTHFIIPETLESVNYGKGPYEPGYGNFTTAGYVAMHTKDILSENLVRTEGGMFGNFRAVSLLKLVDSGAHDAYLATSYNRTDGYFDSPQDFERLNLFAKYHFGKKTGRRMAISLSHFNSSWNASGQIPVRAVRSGRIGRFGAIDDTEGGITSRSDLRWEYRQDLGNKSMIQAHAYLSRYAFELFSNFTFFLNDPEQGDQIRQAEQRWTTGGEVQFHKTLVDSQDQLRYTVASGVRLDQVDDVLLFRTIDRTRVNERLALGDVKEANPYAFGELVYHTGDWTIKPGLRTDLLIFSYADDLEQGLAEDTRNEALVSPKLSLSYTPSTAERYFLKVGSGFHSNDSRVAVARPDAPVLPRAWGADVGAQWKLGQGLLLKSTLWGLALEQEFIYVGDEGIVEPGGRSRRYGVDIGARYQPSAGLYFFSDLTYANARLLDAPAGEDLIPLAPDFTLSAGMSFRDWNSFSGGLTLRYLGDRPATEDGSITAEDYFVTDANLEYTLGKISLGVVVENLFDTAWKETQFATLSRLRNESQGVEELHFTPGTPFSLRARLTAKF